MGISPRLVRRGGVFYRMSVPQRWLAALRRREFQSEVETIDWAKVMQLCRKIGISFDRFFSVNSTMSGLKLWRSVPARHDRRLKVIVYAIRLDATAFFLAGKQSTNLTPPNDRRTLATQ